MRATLATLHSPAPSLRVVILCVLVTGSLVDGAMSNGRAGSTEPSGAAPISPAQTQATREPGTPVPEAEFVKIALEPFWSGRRLRESLFFIQNDPGGRPSARLLFRPTRIAEVTSATRETRFEAGRDYECDAASRTLRLPGGSRIPFKTLDELYPLMTSDAPKIARQAGDRTRGVFFDNTDGYHRLQVEVLYEHEPGEWRGPVPAFAGATLSRSVARLRKREPLRILLSGDSISAGYNASRFTHAPPDCPAYGELVALALAHHYGGSVTFTNYAVSGWNAARGLQQVIEQRLPEQKPDLVLIGFGMNDVFARDPAGYQANVRRIIETFRQGSPETEFVLVAPMLGNEAWGMPMEEFPRHRDALRDLCGPGIALADLTAVWTELLEHKSFYDLTGNGVNHPNDFGHCVYAQAILSLLIPDLGGARR